MNFKIMSREMVEDYISKPLTEDTLFISITNHRQPNVDFSNVQSNCFDCLVVPLQFDDTEVDTKYEHGITQQDVDKIVCFVESFKFGNGTIVVNCDAGVSRSAGVCAAIKKYITGDDMDIFSNPKYCPSMRCYRDVLEGLIGYDLSKSEEKEMRNKFNLNENVWKDEFDLIYGFDDFGNMVDKRCNTDGVIITLKGI